MKIILGIVFFLLLFLLSPSAVYSEEVVSGASAQVYDTSMNKSERKSLIKKQFVIKKMLEKHRSPLVIAVDDFIEACQKYNLDCYLLPSISGLESTFGKFIYPASFNPFGWDGGSMLFPSWREGILTVAQGLRENYINKGAQTIEQIAPIYAESPTWAERVSYFMDQFSNEEYKIELFLDAT
ncbi:glucosaminidase domain-containing protein [Candidatus Roizmanbacteria bacterium]|nr:glucosaminidase domain-containing protein [Candidatus Roizmanbacteria bacterium]